MKFTFIPLIVATDSGASDWVNVGAKKSAKGDRQIM
jgi:hypothetical protein